MAKFSLTDEENEILPNLFGIDNQKDIKISEFEGFLRAVQMVSEKDYSQMRKLIHQLFKFSSNFCENFICTLI